MLRTDTHDNGLSDISAVNELFLLLSRENDLACIAQIQISVRENRRIQEVHLRRSDEAGDEQVARLIVKVLRGIDLLYNAVLHNDDSGTKGHSLGLVMGNVDDRSAQSLMQLGDLGSHLNTELRIQVGQRLIHQEDLRVTDDGTAHGNTLSLTAGQSLRLTVKELLQVKDLGSFADHLVDLILRGLSQLQGECHVIINGHMRIQSVALEYHGDISVLGLHIVDDPVPDLQRTAGNFFQTCDHTQRGRFSASGGSDENDEFLVSDLKIEVLNSFKAVRISFA